MEFLVVQGTVREGRRSIHAARYITEQLRERGHDVTLFDPAEREVPMLRTRTYADPGEPPEAVQEFRDYVVSCDGIILVSPEYNHSYPGALKNLLDHLYPEYEGKPFSYVTVSAGGFGGVRCMEDLESLTVTLNGYPGPGMPVSNVTDVFDGDDLVDKDYVDRFEEFCDKVEAHTERFA